MFLIGSCAVVSSSMHGHLRRRNTLLKTSYVQQTNHRCLHCMCAHAYIHRALKCSARLAQQTPPLFECILLWHVPKPSGIFPSAAWALFRLVLTPPTICSTRQKFCSLHATADGNALIKTSCALTTLLTQTQRVPDLNYSLLQSRLCIKSESCSLVIALVEIYGNTTHFQIKKLLIWDETQIVTNSLNQMHNTMSLCVQRH